MPLTQEALLNYFAEKLGLDPAGIDDETPLFSSSLLDSFSMVDLILFIEQQTGRKINATEVRLDNLDSVSRILRFAGSRKTP